MLTAEAKLGEFAQRGASYVHESGWSLFVACARGTSSLSPHVNVLPHNKAARLLNHLKQMVARILTSTPPWTSEKQHRAVMRGPHKSAHEHQDFVITKILDFCSRGYWAVLLYAKEEPLGVLP